MKTTSVDMFLYIFSHSEGKLLKRRENDKIITPQKETIVFFLEILRAYIICNRLVCTYFNFSSSLPSLHGISLNVTEQNTKHEKANSNLLSSFSPV